MGGLSYFVANNNDPLISADWGLASILTDRDIDSHDLNFPDLDSYKTSPPLY